MSEAKDLLLTTPPKTCNSSIHRLRVCPLFLDPGSPVKQRRPKSKKPQDDQRPGSQPYIPIEDSNRLIRQRGPGQNAEYGIRDQSQCELLLDVQLLLPHLEIPRKTLGISAADSRFAHARKRLNFWCTGEDSNLRTS